MNSPFNFFLFSDESGYTTPEQVETEEKVCIRPEQRRVRLQSEDLSDNDPGYKDRELIKKHLVFDSGNHLSYFYLLVNFVSKYSGILKG